MISKKQMWYIYHNSPKVKRYWIEKHGAIYGYDQCSKCGEIEIDYRKPIWKEYYEIEIGYSIRAIGKCKNCGTWYSIDD